MIDSALFASSDDCEGAASTASVTAASTVTDCETLDTCIVIGRVICVPDASFKPLRTSVEKPGTTTLTEYVPAGRFETVKRPSASVIVFRSAPDASFVMTTVALGIGVLV